MYAKQLTFIWLAVTVFIGFSCKQVGRQPPETRLMMVSADDKYIIRLYSVLNVHYYEKKGGSTFRSGTNTFYLEKYDAATGKLLAQSGKIKRNITPIFITPKHIWLDQWDADMKNREVAAISIDDFSERISPNTLTDANPAVKFVPYSAYTLTANPQQLVLKGNDERWYIIDDATGKGTVVKNTEVKIWKDDFLNNNWKIADTRYDFRGGGRSVLKKRNKKEEWTSADDFIQPHVFGATLTKNFSPVTVSNNWLVFSKTTSDKNFNWQITGLDTATLQTGWVAHYPGEAGNANKDIQKIVLKNSNLLVVTATTAAMLDIKTGKWLWALNFKEPENK